MIPDDDRINNLWNAWCRIENPDHWCQNEYAELTPDARYNFTFDQSPLSDSCWGRWCGLGALAAERGRTFLDPESIPEVPYLRRAAMLLFGRGPVDVNDVIGHAAVRKMYETAINLRLLELSELSIPATQ